MKVARLLLIGCALACSKDRPTEGVNQPFTVRGVQVAPESLNTFLAAKRGITSRGGEMRCAYAPLGQEGVRVFVWALCLEMAPSGGPSAQGSGMSVPAAFTIDARDERARVTAVELPEDGDRFEPSVRRIFPASIQRSILDTGDSHNVRVALLRLHLRGRR